MIEKFLNSINIPDEKSTHMTADVRKQELCLLQGYHTMKTKWRHIQCSLCHNTQTWDTITCTANKALCTTTQRPCLSNTQIKSLH